MVNLNDYPWISATARMSITDVMWTYSIEVDGDASNIPLFQILEYKYQYTNQPLICCVPTSYEIHEDYPDIKTTITGYSKAIFLNNPLPLCERQSKIELYTSADKNEKGESREGEIKSYENPFLYMHRIWNLLDPGLTLWMQEIPAQPETIEEGDTTRYAMDKQYTYDAHPFIELIQEIAEDYDRICFEKITDVYGTPKHWFFLIDFDKIDEYLGLPSSPLVLDASTYHFIGNPGPVTSRDVTDSKNVIWVELCRKKDNAWFFAERKCQSVINGTEKPRIMVYRSSSLLPDPVSDEFINPNTGAKITDPKTQNAGCITVIPGYQDQTGGISFGTKAENDKCQEITDAKADELLNHLEIDVRQYEVSLLLDRNHLYEFQLYQKVIIYGFPDSIPHEVLRVTEIEYEFKHDGDGGDTVRLILVPDVELQAARKFAQMQDDLRSNNIALKQSIERNVINNKMGLVKSLSPGRVYANLQLRSSGRMVQTRAWGERIKK